MGQVLSCVLYRLNYSSDNSDLAFFCPGCECLHIAKPNWKWNGNVDQPTFTPSFNIRAGHYVVGQPQPPNCEHCNEAKDEGYETPCHICHSNVINGKIIFHSDTTHKYQNQTLPLPELPAYMLAKLPK